MVKNTISTIITTTTRMESAGMVVVLRGIIVMAVMQGDTTGITVDLPSNMATGIHRVKPS